MGEPDLMDAFVEMANGTGEEFNDGDIMPGWLTAEWVENGGGGDGLDLVISYENPDNQVITQRYRVERVAG
jgi:hypothetical protein